MSEIGPGLLVFVGLHDSDTDADGDYMYFSTQSLFFLFFKQKKIELQNEFDL